MDGAGSQEPQRFDRGFVIKTHGRQLCRRCHGFQGDVETLSTKLRNHTKDFSAGRKRTMVNASNSISSSTTKQTVFWCAKVARGGLAAGAAILDSRGENKNHKNIPPNRRNQPATRTKRSSNRKRTKLAKKRAIKVTKKGE